MATDKTFGWWESYREVLDQFHGPVLLDAQAHLEKYRLLLDTVEATALTPEKSRDLIHSIAQDL